MFVGTHLIGFGAGAKVTEVLFDRTTGTNIGNMTAGGGLAAGFDGNTAQAAAAGPRFQGRIGWIGKTFPSQNPISRVQVYPSTNVGYINNFNSNVTITLYGKNGAAPASATDGTSLGSLTFTDTNTGPQTVLANDSTAEYQHCWVAIDTGVTDLCEMSELVIYVMT